MSDWARPVDSADVRRIAATLGENELTPPVAAAAKGGDYAEKQATAINPPRNGNR